MSSFEVSRVASFADPGLCPDGTWRHTPVGAEDCGHCNPSSDEELIEYARTFKANGGFTNSPELEKKQSPAPLVEVTTTKCAGCGRDDEPLGGTSKCPDCVAVDVHNYRAHHDGRMKRREYPSGK